jgi:hypothetical protein
MGPAQPEGGPVLAGLRPRGQEPGGLAAARAKDPNPSVLYASIGGAPYHAEGLPDNS